MSKHKRRYSCIFIMMLSFNAASAYKVDSKDFDFVFESLTRHSTSLKVFFIEERRNFSCWVERTHKEQTQKSDAIDVKPAKFKANPLLACLPYSRAMAWLRYQYQKSKSYPPQRSRADSSFSSTQFQQPRIASAYRISRVLILETVLLQIPFCC